MPDAIFLVILPMTTLALGFALGFARGLARGRLDGIAAGIAEAREAEHLAAPARVEEIIQTVLNPKLEAAFVAGFRKGVDTCVRAGLHLPENADPEIQERINIRIVHARNPDGDIISACRSGAI